MNESAIISLIAGCGEIPGKKVFQKLCYFLQEAEGVKLGVRFRMKHFGPYSQELDDRLEDLAERGIVHIAGSSEDGFHISLASEVPAEVESYDAQTQLDSVLAEFRSDLSHGLTLELLATAHFLANRQSYHGTDDDKDELVSRVRAWKAKKFDERFIRENIERLERLGYVPAASK